MCMIYRYGVSLVIVPRGGGGGGGGGVGDCDLAICACWRTPGAASSSSSRCGRSATTSARRSPSTSPGSACCSPACGRPRWSASACSRRSWSLEVGRAKHVFFFFLSPSSPPPPPPPPTPPPPPPPTPHPPPPPPTLPPLLPPLFFFYFFFFLAHPFFPQGLQFIGRLLNFFPPFSPVVRLSPPVSCIPDVSSRSPPISINRDLPLLRQPSFRSRPSACYFCTFIQEVFFEIF